MAEAKAQPNISTEDEKAAAEVLVLPTQSVGVEEAQDVSPSLRENAANFLTGWRFRVVTAPR